MGKEQVNVVDKVVCMSNFQQVAQLHSSGKLTKAEKLFKKLDPSNPSHVKLMMQVDYELEKFSRCITRLESLLKMNTPVILDREIYTLLGMCYLRLNNVRGCIKNLEKSIAIDSSVDNAKTVYKLADIYLYHGRFKDAEALGVKLTNWSHYAIEGLMLLVTCAANQGNRCLLLSRIKSVFPYVDTLKVSQFETLFYYLIKLNEKELAQVLLDKRPEHLASALTYDARLALATNDATRAIKLLADSDDVRSNANVLYLLGQAYHQHGDYSLAFQTLEKAAQLKSKTLKKVASVNLVTLRKLLKNFQFKPSNNEASNFQHVFVCGFPRSGTTLIDNILETQEQSYVLSEQPFIYLLKEYMRSEFNKQYPKDVNRLTDKECSELRAMYFQLINQIDAPTDKQNIIVDKSPHYIGYIPFILKVFPSAKFLISIRHPLDVCLSCHRVNFNVNSDTQYLVSMKAIVERYKEVFTFFEHLSEQVVFDYRVVKYEELVTNFDEAILEALQYIGVEKPNAEYVNFHETAKQKFVSSASSNQTNQPLYSSSLFSWKNYADEIEEYIPALSTMIEKWGY